ncbi:laccase, partial [Pseudomonas syringae pv. syringae]
MNDWLIPDWPAPAQIKSCVTTRSGGVSLAPFDSFNLGDHVDDSPQAVASNRSIMTADCLPALFCRRDGTRVAAAHAGWRGLAAGVLEATANSLQSAAEDIMVWLGPSIGQPSFEVGPEVREAFTASHPQTAAAFVASSNPDRFMADIYALARLRLAAQGISAVYGGGLDTFTDPRFFSYRRAARTGRFA